jgi:CDP-diacylglycerol--serine O-phosphatidyltransferase
MKKEPNLDEFTLKKIINIPDTITFLDVFFGLAAIYFAIQNKFLLSSIMMFIAIVMDYLDGKAARLLHEKTKLGKELDSLADIISFGIAPALFGFFYHKANSACPSVFLLLSIFFFIICGIIRLGRYNLIRYSKGFIGMPITVNALVLPILYFISLPIYLLPIVYIILGLLMVSSIKIKRVL